MENIQPLNPKKSNNDYLINGLSKPNIYDKIAAYCGVIGIIISVAALVISVQSYRVQIKENYNYPPNHKPANLKKGMCKPIKQTQHPIKK